MSHTLPLIKHIILVTIVCFGWLLSFGGVSAQGAGVSISPAFIEETIDPGDVKTYQLEIENLNQSDQQYFIFKRNISGVNDSSVPIFATSDTEVTGYELVDWITLDTNQVNLGPNEKQTVSFTINTPTKASPGSYFGGLFVSADPPDLEENGASVGYQVANIVSIRISGEAVESASIRQFSTSRFLYGAQEVDFSVRVENEGNVLVRPTGLIQIKNSLGKEVGQINFNESLGAVFPADTRTFEELWVGDAPGFGRYEADLSLVYGQTGARYTIASTATFWILPVGIIGPAGAVLAFFILITFISARIYIRRALAIASGGRRLVRRRRQSGPSLPFLLLVSVLVVTALFLLVMLLLFA